MVLVHIGPAYRVPGRNVMSNLHAIGKSNRKCTEFQAVVGGHQFSPHGVATFGIEELTGCQVLLCGGNDITTKVHGAFGRFTSKHCGED